MHKCGFSQKANEDSKAASVGYLGRAAHLQHGLQMQWKWAWTLITTVRYLLVSHTSYSYGEA